MSYTRPEEVLSPRNRVVRVLEVIHDPREEGMSVARVLWKNEDGTEQQVIATRWNGNDERPLGNPISRGQPTWFVVDKYAEQAVETAAREQAEKLSTSVAAGYRRMAEDQEREREATEWCEGLLRESSGE